MSKYATHHYKKYDTMFRDIQQLAVLLSSTSPYRTTRNNFNRLVHQLPILPHLDKDKLELLYHQLVHGITVMNQLYRVTEESYLLSTREDNLTALNIMQKLAFPQQKLIHQADSFYSELYAHFGREVFTRLDAHLRLSKFPYSTISRHFRDLEYAGLIQFVGYGKYRRKNYQIVV